MSFENRENFEQKLFKILKEIEHSNSMIKASKNKLKFKIAKINVAELYIQHLARVDSYYLGGTVFGGTIFDFLSKVSPPYKNNLFNESCCSFTTLGKEDKKFSLEMGGAIKTPSIIEVEAVCGHIKKSLEEHYIPKIIACIVPSKRTIRDVLESPDEYSYPAPFIHCAIKSDATIAENTLLEQVRKHKKIIKNKEFDLRLLEGF